MIGLLGAHRTGKTTLCKELTNGHTNTLRELEVSISKMAKEWGYDSSKQDYSWEEHKLLQERLYTAFAIKLTLLPSAKLGTPIYMTERTPLDLIGYAFINAPETMTESDKAWLSEYKDKCIQITNDYYKAVFMLQPGIPYVDSETSFKEDTIDELNAVYLSVLLDSKLQTPCIVLPSSMLDLAERKQFIEDNLHALSLAS